MTILPAGQSARERAVEAMARAIEAATIVDDSTWRWWIPEATAALDAALEVLNEPTIEMVNAGCTTGDDWAYRTFRAMLATVREPAK